MKYDTNAINDPDSLTESLEQTRLDKRKLESQVAQLQAQASAPTPSSSSNGGDVEELQDQIADLEEELKDAKAREQKVRSQLLDVSSVARSECHMSACTICSHSMNLLQELSTVQSEVSSLKTQLRQAQRKMGK